ncbi:MAG: ATP-binding protein [Bilophila wadsworthia]
MKEYRNIIEIDRERCNGCGQCVLDCAEGAIAIIDGKATVVSDSYCDGLARAFPDARRTRLPSCAGKPCRSTKRQPCATSPGRRKSAGNSFFSRSAARAARNARLRMLRDHRAGIRSTEAAGKQGGRAGW